MGEPVRLQLSRKRGFDLQAISLATNGLPAVNVARPGVCSNPFRSSPDAPRSHAFEAGLFRDWLIELLGATHLRTAEKQDFIQFMRRMSVGCDATALQRRGERLKQALPLLAGKNLACWCPLTDANGNRCPCHADVLLELANLSPNGR